MSSSVFCHAHGLCCLTLTVEVTWICDMSGPFPGLKILAIVSATLIAKYVVHE